MKIQTVQYIRLSDIATIIGVDLDELIELYTGNYTWEAVGMSLVNLPEFLCQITHTEEEAVMEALWDIIGTDEKDAAKYFVDLSS